jgi:hypothetical protein
MHRLRKKSGKQNITHYNLKNNKVPQNKFNKETKDLFHENYKPLKREIEDFHAHGSVESIL